MYKNFVELLEAYPVASNKKVAAICAHEDHVIEAMIDVHQRYDVQPILIGHEDEIRMLLAKQNCFTTTIYIGVKAGVIRKLQTSPFMSEHKK